MVDLGHALKADCARLLAGIAVPKPFNLGIFCRDLAEQRGRRLEILPLKHPASEHHPFGMWLATGDMDLLFLDESTSEWHRDLIAAHEIAHMLWGDDTVDDAALSQLFPGLDPGAVRAMLGWPAPATSRLPGPLGRLEVRRQHDYTERRAELTATMLLARAEHPMTGTDHTLAAATRVPASWSIDV